MNGWDLFTYLMCGLLGVSSVWIFALFLRDARGIIDGSAGQGDEDEDEHEDEDWDESRSD